ncbi:MAG: hypothetical protein ACLR6B_16810 [Blautia sp.]
MTNEKIKQMFDACYQAKRIREMLPPLPEGVMPSYIKYLDTIQGLEKRGFRSKYPISVINWNFRDPESPGQ